MERMNIPLITWCCIAAVVMVIVVVRVSAALLHRRHMAAPSRHGRHRFIEVGREWEELYVPGDRIIRNDYDYDECDDL